MSCNPSTHLRLRVSRISPSAMEEGYHTPNFQGRVQRLPSHRAPESTGKAQRKNCLVETRRRSLPPQQPVWVPLRNVYHRRCSPGSQPICPPHDHRPQIRSCLSRHHQGVRQSSYGKTDLQIKSRFSISPWITASLRDWLSDRSVAIRFQAALATYMPVKYGLPQGSPLRVLLSQLFIDDKLTKMKQWARELRVSFGVHKCCPSQEEIYLLAHFLWRADEG
jgi:hypothetical protein